MQNYRHHQSFRNLFLITYNTVFNCILIDKEQILELQKTLISAFSLRY